MDKRLVTAIRASIEAGYAIMEVYDSADFNIEQKDDDSPLTAADIRSNSVINQYLNSTGIPIISEENRQLEYEERKSWDLCWIVDPLDGTKEFIKRNGEFTVNIALIENSFPLLGVIFVPAKNIIYYADGNIAWKQVLIQTDSGAFDHSKSVKISPQKENGKIRVVGSRSHMNEDTESYIANLKENYNQEIEVVSRGSSLKFCLVAEGEADVYPRFAPTMEWDTAAGHAICNSVGLSVIDKKTGEEMKYNRTHLLNNHFLVSAIG
ncbi:3'(2'),5'-bisphosphate nucleotidase CysQ [Gramella jeungdoensis]|uniref:3'(2'),5'-bisphosphate nucleotidase CysQ n=1 Tax=Gramella jeungdoensis TaxID=708091 RepID=A0ABT0Z469_9FLAO|nr:3'(2'),5'-bisphosphate nucleotidase CysQ [Gramella jeungdoensis]MCM8570502.1 3'(2'),5'-bisphosphate nucleotidase CysQ [Gramella jeungdoensis]